MKLVGSNFPVARPTAVLTNEAAPAISRKATHVLIRPTDVFTDSSAKVAIQQLPPGTLVTLLRAEQGWAIIAKEGTRLGYVDASALALVQ